MSDVREIVLSMLCALSAAGGLVSWTLGFVELFDALTNDTVGVSWTSAGGAWALFALGALLLALAVLAFIGNVLANK